MIHNPRSPHSWMQLKIWILSCSTSWAARFRAAGGRAVDRELVLAALVALVVGPLIVGVAAVRWRSIWTPVIPAAGAFALLIGWALVEPADAEPVPAWTLVVALPVAIVWARAIVRALRALRAPNDPAAADTVGLRRPRVRIAPWFRDSLDPSALAAAIAHERAHARHRDPLRIWLAQIVTDLQWPIPRAAQRFARWRHSLELARDDEARRHGTDGADLAAAIVAAAKRPGPVRLAGASLCARDLELRERIERLLSPLPPGATGDQAASWWASNRGCRRRRRV